MTDSAQDFPDEVEIEEMPLDPAVTRELFLQWRAPRFGSSNPERMNNPVWEWLVRSQVTAFSINERLEGPSPFDAGPAWCFKRFGQSATSLSDGRVVLIGGEHEDSYDADFCIYNDVIVRHPDGHLDIFGYPKEVFSPTDFHSATLVQDKIVIIGCLGYPDQWKAATTPVFLLDLTTFAISTVLVSGSAPGWIFEHTADLADNGGSILVRGGNIGVTNNTRSLTRQIDDWRLDLVKWSWERLTDRQWQQWEVRRIDSKPLHLWQVQSALWSRGSGCAEFLEDDLRRLKEALGFLPDLDVAARLYRPDLEHEEIPEVENEPSVRRIKIAGVVVHYDEDMQGIQVTIEGALPQSTIDVVISDLRDKLALLLNSPCAARRL